MYHFRFCTPVTSQEIQEICKPLFDFLGVDYFGFVRVYKDQSHICLTTNTAWKEYYYNKIYYIGRSHEYFNEDDLSSFALSDLQSSHPLLIDFKKKFGMDHNLWITKKYPNYKDTFTIATSLSNENINNIYLSNLDVIEKFIYYFLSKAAILIEKAEKEKFFLNNLETNMNLNPKLNRNNSSLIKFNQQINLKKFFFLIKDKKVYLSSREIECLKGIYKGKTLKLIGRDLDISHRTVESYLLNIKYKFHCSTKENLLKIISQDPYLEKYLLMN